MQVTVISSTRPAVLSKQIGRDVNGALTKTSSAALMDGQADAVAINSMGDFSQLLRSLSANQALAYGVTGMQSVPLVNGNRLSENPGAITRSDKHIAWPNGPAVMYFDYDPAADGQALSRDELLAALFATFPQIAAHAWLWCPSASGNIYDAQTGQELVGLKGQRVYIVAQNAKDIPRAGDAAFKRLWLAGHGRVELARNGAQLVRGLIDASVWQPSRLDFAAGAVCAPGLMQVRPEHLVQDGAPVDTQAMFPALTDDEERAFREAVAAARKAAEPQSARVRDMFVNETAAREGVAPEAVRARYELAEERSVLGLDFPVTMAYQDEQVTVRDILENPGKFHGKICLDPVEPEYNNYHPVGKIFNDEKGAYIDSKAHGGRVFKLGSVAALAFQQAASDGETFNDLMHRIGVEGCDLSHVPDLTKHINEGPFCEAEQTLLRAELKAELKAAKRLDKSVEALIAGSKPPAQSSNTTGGGVERAGLYGKADADNAAIFMQRYITPGEWCVHAEEVYRFERGAWRSQGRKDALVGPIWRDMARSPDAMMARAKSAAESVFHALPVYEDLGKHSSNMVYFADVGINTDTWELVPHGPENRNTFAVDFPYQPMATCPEWHKFINSSFEGDEAKIALLQEWIGYNLIGSYRHQRIMLFLGQSRGGKGAIGKVLADILGEGRAFSGGSLSAICRDTTLNNMRNSLAYFVGDSEQNIHPMIQSQVVEALKSISGNDPRTFDRKYIEAMTVRIPARITIAANGVPAIFEDSAALINRMLVLMFEVSFQGRGDPHLEEKLERESAGIVNWALEGLKRLNEAGDFTEPESSTEARDYIGGLISPMKEFIEECCTYEEGAMATPLELLDAYREWRQLRGEDTKMAQRTCTEAFKRASTPFKHTRIRGPEGNRWYFLGLKISVNRDAVVSAASKAFAPK